EVSLLVVADFADGYDPFLESIPGQDLHDRLGQLLVVGLLRIEANRAVVAQPELAGAKPFEATNHGKVIDVRADIGARLAEPERRLDAGDNPCSGHALIVIGGTRDHVRVGVEVHGVSSETRFTPARPHSQLLSRSAPRP